MNQYTFEPTTFEKSQEMVRPLDRAPALLLHAGPKFSYAVMLSSGHVRVVKIPNAVIYRDWSILRKGSALSNMESAVLIRGVAHRFLESGTKVGITGVAKAYLNEVLSREGVDVSAIETKTAKQTEAPKVAKTPTTAKAPPAPAKVAEAVAKAKTPAKPAATKNGTTAEAKKPGKVEKTKVATPATKPAAKPAKAAGRPTTLDPAKKIKVLVTENPRREGSQVAINFDKFVKKYNGKTVAAYLEAGGRGDMIIDDIKREYVALV